MRRFCQKALLAAALSLTVQLHPALADDQHNATAIVVDVQRILDESEAAKGAQKQLNSQRSHFQTETEKEENQLRQAEEDLSKSHDKISSDAYAEREQQLRQRFVEVERHVESRRKTLDQSFTDAMNAVRDKLIDVAQNVAHEHNANIVLVKQQVLWSDKNLDATDEILARLNKELPQVDFKKADDSDTK
jgi:Skp family chaperone for outer membrane proteins